MLSEILSAWLEDHLWMTIAIMAALSSCTAIFADRKRARRINLENVGFMPWTGLSVLGIFITIAAIAMTIKTEFGG